MNIKRHILQKWWLVLIILMSLVIIISIVYKYAAWEKAKAKNNIPAYEAFIKQYPKWFLADKARLNLEKLYNERHPSLKNTKTVKIIIEQSYKSDFHDKFPYREIRDINFPFGDVARKICEYAGLKSVSADAKDYDVILKIKAEGRAISARYYNYPMNNYSGASILGIISLKTPTMPAYEKLFKGEISPPKFISKSYPTPSSAPFDEVFYKYGVPAIIETIYEFYGMNTLVNALKDDEWYIKDQAEVMLEKIGEPAVEPLIILLKDKNYEARRRAAQMLGIIKDSRAIEPLINKLKDVDPLARKNAAWSLRMITKQNFEEDSEAWSKWWKENKNTFQQTMKK